MASSSSETVSVLVADDRSESRLLVRLVVDRAGDCAIVGEATTGKEAAELAATYRPAVILIDVHFSEADGEETVHRLRAASPTSAIVVLSSDPETKADAERLGVAWVDKTRLLKDLPAILRSLRSSRETA